MAFTSREEVEGALKAVYAECRQGEPDLNAKIVLNLRSPNEGEAIERGVLASEIEEKFEIKISDGELEKIEDGMGFLELICGKLGIQ